MTYDPSDFLDYSHIAVTLRLADPRSDLLIRRLPLLRDCVALSRQRWPFDILAACVLPAEVHMLCRLPAGHSMTHANRMICRAFARHADAGSAQLLWDGDGQESPVPPAAVAMGCRFLLDAPVRARLVPVGADWPYSSHHARGAPAASGLVAASAA